MNKWHARDTHETVNNNSRTNPCRLLNLTETSVNYNLRPLKYEGGCYAELCCTSGSSQFAIKR
jgi:hypothetical protein